MYKKVELQNIANEIDFREFIWRDVICLREKCARYDIRFNEVVSAVKKIVFDRAINFSSGIREDNLDSNILRALESENIINCSSGKVRLKYDIFEDI